jgi:glycosyltransferase involved in cell wall biosynthesis
LGNAKQEMKYNILYVDSSQDIHGGGQISLLELLKKIDKTKFKPLVVLSEAGKLQKAVEQINLDYKIISMPAIKPRGIFSFIGTIWKLSRVIRQRQITLVHTNTTRATIYVSLATLVLNIPVVWHVRIPHTDGLLDRYLASTSSFIIVVSQAVKKRFNWLKKEKIKVIYNGVDTKSFSPGQPSDGIMSKFNLKNENVVIGAVGRISPEKGLEFLISAIKDVIKVYSHAKVLIVGEGNTQYHFALQTKVDELSLSSNVIFTGFHEDVPEILRCIDIFCLPSMTEGFNRTLLEAMSCGLPIIATSVGGNVEIIQDGVNGLLVPPGNSSALASAIIELLQNKRKAQKMGTEGRRVVEQNFNIQTNVNQIQELYSNLLKFNFNS